MIGPWGEGEEGGSPQLSLPTGCEGHRCDRTNYRQEANAAHQPLVSRTSAASSLSSALQVGALLQGYPPAPIWTGGMWKVVEKASAQPAVEFSLTVNVFRETV